MKKLLFFIFASFRLFAQDAPRATFHAWADGFATTQGAMLYPQYAWSVKTSVGTLAGYGFWETTPHEEAFSNHLLNFTPAKAKWFAVHTETGGFPAHNLGFFQVGPRVNLTEAIPVLKKPIRQLFVAVLPRFIGIRPNNILIGGATNSVNFKGAEVWGEGYRRFFHKGPAYGEYWVLVKPNRQSHIAYAVIGHHNGPTSYVGIGLRISFF